MALLAPSLARGGAETVVYELAVALRDSERFQPVVYAAYSGGPLAATLADAGIRVRVLRELEPAKTAFRRRLPVSGTSRLDWYAPATRDVIPLHRFSTTWFRFAADAVVLPPLIHAIRLDSPRILHAHSTSLAPLVAMSRVLTQVPVLLTAHNEGHVRERVPERIRLWLAGRAIDAATGVTPAASAHLAAQLGWPDWRVRVVANGIDPREMIRIPEATEAPSFGIAGNLHAHKGHRMLLRAFHSVLAACPSARLFVLGDGPERNALAELCAALKMEESVTFLGRYDGTSDPKYVRFFGEIGALVMCSLAEGAPLVVLEAMAAGRAVIAPKMGALPQMVQDGETGVLINPNDVRALSAVLSKLAADPTVARAMGRQGRARFQAHFMADVMTSRYSQAYADMLNAMQA